MKNKKLNFDYKEQLKNNNVIAIVPTGNSMWPTLKNRKQSVIIARKTQRLKPFDVALYLRENGTYVLHRVMKVNDENKKTYTKKDLQTMFNNIPPITRNLMINKAIQTKYEKMCTIETTKTRK